jgi:hypothetical protein
MAVKTILGHQVGTLESGLSVVYANLICSGCSWLSFEDRLVGTKTTSEGWSYCPLEPTKLPLFTRTDFKEARKRLQSPYVVELVAIREQLIWPSESERIQQAA